MPRNAPICRSNDSRCRRQAPTGTPQQWWGVPNDLPSLPNVGWLAGCPSVVVVCGGVGGTIAAELQPKAAAKSVRKKADEHKKVAGGRAVTLHQTDGQ